MRTAQQVFDEIAAIKSADPDADAVEKIRRYGEEVKEACAKAIEDELAAVNQIPFAEKCRFLPLP